MKRLVLLILFLSFSLLIISCEKDDPADENLRNEYIGTWDVTENTGINAPQVYSVSIVKGSTPDELVIEGFYNFPQAEVMARVNGFSFSIPQQTSQGINFSGSGQANGDFDRLEVDFIANDGTGNDSVNAVFQR